MNKTEVFIVVLGFITLCIVVLAWQGFRIWASYRDRIYREEMEARIQGANKGERS